MAERMVTKKAEAPEPTLTLPHAITLAALFIMLLGILKYFGIVL